MVRRRQPERGRRRRQAGRSTAAAVALVALLCVLVLTVVWLLQLRIRRGDVYPRYSSLRTDPLGTAVLARALGAIDGMAVEQNLDPLHRLGGGPGTTILVLGLSAEAQVWVDGPAQQLLQAAQHGARVVVTFSGEMPWYAVVDVETLEEADEDEDGDSEENQESPEQLLAGDELELGPWGVALEQHPLPLDESRVSGRRPVPVELATNELLPEDLVWHSPLVVAEANPSWRVVYERDGAPVLITRDLGRGSLVLATDSYFVSNEALQAHRQPRLLAWLVGPASRVVFDETHLGVGRRVGVMVLARRYRLLGFFVALAVLAALYVWRVALPLVASPVAHGLRSGAPSRAASAALVNLLRRGLADDGKLLAACVSAWKRSFASTEEPELVARIDRLAAEASSAWEGHHRIRSAIAEHRRGGRVKTEPEQQSAPTKATGAAGAENGTGADQENG